ncbi:MAG: cation diffusion facilitator family transporter [Elusimicrobiota bacterium]
MSDKKGNLENKNHNHSEHEEHNHSHGFHSHSHVFNENKKNKFLWVIIINFSISIFEIAAGVLSSSVALIADAFHNLEDTASVVLSLIAWKISFKKPDREKTYGYKRAEIVAAFLNSVFLMAVCVFLISESVKRFFSPREINSDFMLIAAFAAFLANMVSVWLLKEDSKDNINWKSAYLHMLGDALFSLAVIAGALSVKIWNFYWADPILSFSMSVFIIIQTFKVFKKSLSILMQSSADLDYEKIKKEIENLQGVKNIHHVHTWMTNENTVYFEAHVEVEEMTVSKTCEISSKAEEILKKNYGIYHTTLQFETDRCQKKEMFGN